MVDPEFSELHSDLLFSARLSGRPVLLYVLFEHQRTVDPLMPFRLLLYVLRVWQRWRRDHPKAKRLPAVIPLVLHQGTRPWSGPRRLTELIDLPPGLLQATARHLPELELPLIDLAEPTPTFQLLERLARSPLAKLALAFMQRAVDPDADLAQVLTEQAAAVRLLLRAPGGPEGLRSVLLYTFNVRRGLDVGAVFTAAEQAAGRQAGEVVMNTAQELVNKGRVEGRAEGVRELLEHIVHVRFGPEALPPSLAKRLDAASADELKAWAKHAVTAERVEDVFTPARPRRRRAKKK